MTFRVVFTDLDGTLLDHHSYSHDPARPALGRLREAGIPLILVSSKTRTEIEAIRTELENHDPFIPENGGAVFIPQGYGISLPADSISKDGYHTILLGRFSEDIAPLFDRLSEKIPVRALSRMPVETVSELTGLTPEQAAAARSREFGEAFVVDDPDLPQAVLEKEVKALGLRLTRGGRFYHLLGENDKGRAVKILTGLFRERHPALLTAACGDAPNDEPMLASVDQAYLMARPDGSHCGLHVPGMKKSPHPGPAGFNWAVSDFLKL